MQSLDVKKLQGITEEELDELATLFNALADVTRLKMLYLSCQQGDFLNQAEMGEYIQKEQSTFVHHMTVLRNAWILQRKRKGLHCYHSPRKYQLKRMLDFLNMCLEMESKQ